MMAKQKTINRAELAGIISEHTGYTKEVVKEILESKDLAVAELIAKGYSIKDHKMYRLDITTRKEKKAWDGINKKRFIVPEKQDIKFVPLVELKDALEKLNEKA